MTGIVVRATGSWFWVRCPEGVIVNCRLRGQFRIKGLKATSPVVVGDNVDIEVLKEEEPGLITKIHPRKNYIIRRATRLSKVSHIVAANLDLAVVVATLAYPRTSSGFIDRFLATAQAYLIPAAVVFNKMDLYNPKQLNQMNEMIACYSKIGYQSIGVSALNGEGMKHFAAFFNNRVVLLSGHSGVGKSALVNFIEPELNLKTSRISSFHEKGVHTTTFAEMHALSGGGYVIDTPGIKEFGLIDLKKEELSHFFPEFLKLLGECRFYNCTHINEPGCAIKKAVELGKIHYWRYQNYQNMLKGSEMNEQDWELK